MARTVKADTERRDLVSRETTVKATDKTTVLGTATLMAGAIQQVSAGDYSQAVKGNRLASIEGNDETDITGKQSTKVAGTVDVDVGGTLTEKIAALRKSVAAGGQQIMGLGRRPSRTMSRAVPIGVPVMRQYSSIGR